MINKRLFILAKLLERLKQGSFSDQHGIADFIDTDEKVKKQMNSLSAESEFYQKMLKEIDNIKI